MSPRSDRLPRARSSARVVAASLAAVVLSAGLGACGSSSSDDDDNAAVELRIERERADAAAAARQEQKLQDLRREVRRLKQEKGAGAAASGAAAAPAPAQEAERSVPAADSSVKIFHAPSGNVACRVSSTGAACTVAAIATTFVFDGGAGRIVSGADVPRGAGYEVGWGESVGVGSVTCSVPPSDDPRGITCSDGATGHGFEASRVPSRRRVF